jgi:hypothetical protein
VRVFAVVSWRDTDARAAACERRCGGDHPNSDPDPNPDSDASGYANSHTTPNTDSWRNANKQLRKVA